MDIIFNLFMIVGGMYGTSLLIDSLLVLPKKIMFFKSASYLLVAVLFYAFVANRILDNTGVKILISAIFAIVSIEMISEFLLGLIKYPKIAHTGLMVRALDRNNIGQIVDINYYGGVFEVYFYNKRTGAAASRSFFPHEIRTLGGRPIIINDPFKGI